MLTDVERAVLVLVADGFTTKEIADRLDRSVHAIEATVRSANRKLGAVTRMQAAARATGADGPGADRLDEIQRELLRLRADGMTVAAAARTVHVSRRTAWRRLAAARVVLGVDRNAAAVTRIAAAGDDTAAHVLRLVAS
jgi:DNA-binding CsgD family transcriptional regulator